MRCIYRFRKKDGWLIVVGDHNLYISEKTQIVRSMALDPIIHKDYNFNNIADGNDIALVRLSKPVPHSTHVTNVCLPRPGITFPAGTKCVTTGWGHTQGKLFRTVYFNTVL